MPDHNHDHHNYLPAIFGAIAGATFLTVLLALVIFRIQRRRLRGQPQVWQRGHHHQRRRHQQTKNISPYESDEEQASAPGRYNASTENPREAFSSLSRPPTIQFAVPARSGTVGPTVFPKTPRAPPPVASPGLSPRPSPGLSPGLYSPGQPSPALSPGPSPGLSRWERYGREHGDE